MPFYNIPATEAMGLADYGERSNDPETGSGDTAFLDQVVRLTERQLHRYALTQTQTEAEAAAAATATTSASLPGTAVEAPPGHGEAAKTAAATATVERPLPYPSLFLNTPHALVRCSWSTRADAPTRRAAADPLSRQLPPAPPAYLLATTQPDTENNSASGSSSVHTYAPAADATTAPPQWADVRQQAKTQRAPHLSGEGAQTLAVAADMPRCEETRSPYALDLHRDPRARERVSVVLQSEVGLAVSAPPPRWASPEAATVNARAPETFIMSPDATSCVLVACRVRLHPRWRRQPPTSSAAESALFVDLCTKTCTASMAHFDTGSEETEAAVHDMLWRGAIPAWLHAVVEHYKATIMVAADHHHHAEEEDEESGTAAFCDARVQQAEAALALLRTWLVPSSVDSSSSAHQPTGGDDDDDGLPAAARVVQPEEAPLSLLHVDWYVVGGIRMRRHAAPTLGRLFRAFFPTRHTATSVLSTARALTDLLCHSPQLDTSAGTEVTVQHRLREDGLCFWSLNTYVSHWPVDKESPSRRYAFPMCIGLLLRLEDGACWPVKLQPGTRDYPLARLRQVLGSGVRWISPNESTATAAAKQCWRAHHLNTVTTATATAAATSTTETKAAAVEDGELLTGLLVSTALVSVPKEARPFTAVVTSAGHAIPQRVISLSWYVKRCLSVLAAWCAETETAHADAHRIFPVVLPARATWTELDRAANAGVLTMPDIFFLQFSTTPHCEPEDFADMVRTNFGTMMTWKHRDVFAPSTDGLLIESAGNATV